MAGTSRSTMLAVVKVNREPGPSGTEIREVPRPAAGPNETLIRVASTSICGTDRHIYNADPSMQSMLQPAKIYGHEFCGFIEEIGPGGPTGRLREGDYVSAEMHVTCGWCHQCRTGAGHICSNTHILGVHGDGCFAEYVKVPTSNVIRLDYSIPPTTASFLDALGNAVHTLQPHRTAGRDVLVTGYGPIGAMAVSVTHHVGARRIIVTDVNPFALDHARKWAADRGITDRFSALDVSSMSDEEIREAVARLCPHGPDILLEMSGAEAALNMGLALLKNGGGVSLLGIPRGERLTIERYARDLIFKGITIHAIIGRRMFDTWFTMIKLLHGGLDVEHIVTKTYPSLEKFHDAMELLNGNRAMKIVFDLAGGSR